MDGAGYEATAFSHHADDESHHRVRLWRRLQRFESDAHGADGTAQHLQRHTRSRIALNGFFYFNSDVAHDATLRALTGPFGADVSHGSLKNHFGPPHQIIKRRRDNSGGQSRAGHN